VNGFLIALRSIGPARLLMIALVGAASIGFFAYLGTRITAPTFGLLYSDLDLRDSGQIVQKLDGMGVPYQLKGDGSSILVPIDQVARLRMMVAEAGLPRGGSVGYELFDKSESLGTSNFVQNVNQLRALEGELARTITAIGSISAARVHLVLPRREIFSREKPEASASIALKLRSAERLSKGQIAAIQHLVASAVSGLKANRISIVDNEGTLLARGGGDDTQDTAGNGEELRTGYETRLGRTVEEMLERTLGPGKVRVEVRADMDFDRVTTSSESFDPEGQVVRSTQTTSESNDSAEAGDQPVTVANNLPDAQAQRGSSGARAKNTKSEETVNYEITKTVKSHVREAGLVRRLSVAVLVDGTYAVGADKARTYAPRNQEELQQIGTLVRSAIGFNQSRGDVVEVVNLRFAAAAEDAVAEPKASLLGLGKDDFFRIGETAVLAVLAILVLLLVIRPMLSRILTLSAAGQAAANMSGTRLLTDQSAPQAALPAPAGMAAAMPVMAQLAAAGVPGSELAAMSGQTLEAVEQMIDLSRVEGRVRASSLKKVGEIVDKHPEEAVAILRSWMYQGT
jgi:flagellar M-ring protein FliF